MKKSRFSGKKNITGWSAVSVDLLQVLFDLRENRCGRSLSRDQAAASRRTLEVEGRRIGAARLSFENG
jgi:hypothetical protein